ncbi:MAG: carboxypeptidase regulatory-like domain-containing protein [Deltaproteobacteria bacterium]|nr:carboxypeptidase regulatory-like domain-containing protein [Deltaproteobacteria bacterium]
MERGDLKRVLPLVVLGGAAASLLLLLVIPVFDEAEPTPAVDGEEDGAAAVPPASAAGREGGSARRGDGADVPASAPGTAPADAPASSLDHGAGSGVLAGMVVDRDSEGIPGISVAVLPATGERVEAVIRWSANHALHAKPGRTMTTDDRGFFRATGLPPAGTVVVIAWGGGYVRRLERPVEVPEVGEGWVEIRLERGETISGRITDEAGRAIEGATVTAHRMRSWGSAGAEEGTSDVGGAYVVAGLVAGAYYLDVEADGFVDQSRSPVSAGATGVDVTLQAGGVIAGKVVWRGSGSPIAGAGVRAVRLDDTNPLAGGRFLERVAAKSSEDGTFEIAGLAPGRYAVEADAAQRAPGRSAPLEIALAGRVVGVVIELAEGATVSGTVRREGDGEPVEGASVWLSRLTDDAGFLSGWMREAELELQPQERGEPDGETATVTDGEGRFTLRCVGSGRRELIARREGYPGAWATVEVPLDGSVEGVAILLPAAGAIAGTVRGEDGAPAGGAQIIAFSMAGSMAHSECGVDGAYRLEGLKPARYEVMATLAGPEGDEEFDPFGGPRLHGTATVRVGEVTTLDLRPAGGTTVIGRVSRAGEPVPEATVILMPDPPTKPEFRSGQTDDQGIYRVVGVAPGPTILSIESLTVHADIPDVPEHVLDVEIPTGSVRGRVLAAATGEPVLQAQVQLVVSGPPPAPDDFAAIIGRARGLAESEADGAFVIEGIGDGAYELHASHADYRMAVGRVVVAGGVAGGPVELRLERGLSVSGTVVGPDGRPVAGALIDVRAADGEFVEGAGGFAGRMTDASGRFEFSELGRGEFRMRAFAPNLAPSAFVTVAVTDEGATVDFRLTAGGRLAVRVVDVRDEPVVDTAVALADGSGESVLSSLLLVPFLGGTDRTDDRGELTLEHLAAGNYVVSVNGEGASGQAAAQVADGGTTTVLVRLERR